MYLQAVCLWRCDELHMLIVCTCRLCVCGDAMNYTSVVLAGYVSVAMPWTTRVSCVSLQAVSRVTVIALGPPTTHAWSEAASVSASRV